MNSLILDTSTNYLVVGVLKNKESFFETRIGKNDNSAYIINKIDIALKKSNLKIDDINNIIVGIGPGSYTGIRVSVVAAKMLAYTKNIELREISSIALLTSGYENEITGMIDARRNHVFKGRYNKAKLISKDEYIDQNNINESNLVMLNENTIKIDLLNVYNNSKKVNNIHNLEPNYLRVTEAERNL